MSVFESLLILLAISIVLLRLSRTIAVPYPTMLAMAGVVVAALPQAPSLTLEPELALALFIAPALLDAGFDLPPRTVRREWVAVVALAVFAVIVTTIAVALVGVLWGGMPLVAALALGAIVAPPDAAAASAMLARFSLPRRTLAVLQSESLLNDAVALMVFGAAVGAAAPHVETSTLVVRLAIAAPGGILFGLITGRLYTIVVKPLVGSLAGTLAQFVATFGVWVIAERLHLSAVLAVVAYAMTLAHIVPGQTTARDRVHSYAVWGAVVFVLNVLAFLLIGMQARHIIMRLPSHELAWSVGFAAGITGVVVVVRFAWVMLFGWFSRKYPRVRGGSPPTMSQTIVVAWCGMRGLVTLATALALPENFPSRDIVVLSAFGVVIGTLVVQGLTLGPLIRRLTFPKDDSYDRELETARIAIIDAALVKVGDRDDRAAREIRATYDEARTAAKEGHQRAETSDVEALRRELVSVKRAELFELRRKNEIGDDVFHHIERELDMIELAATPVEGAEIVEG